MMIENYKNSDEIILWKGKPNKSVYIKERIFSPFALVAIVWFIFDIGFIITFMANSSFNGPVGLPIMLVPFFILHLLPVWIYIGRIIFGYASWKNTEYMVTDKAVYHLSGVFQTKCDRKTFQEITNVSVHQGIIDKHHDVGDVFIITGHTTTSNGVSKPVGINIIDIEDYMKVYKLINRTGTDVYSDTMYPNDLRPEENHGYKTEYKNFDNE